MNDEVTAEGMQVKSADLPFELKSVSNNGLYDTLLVETVSGYGDAETTEGLSGIKWNLTSDSQ